MTGVPIGSADSSERFLHDIRQTIAELLHDEFYVTMARLAHAKGCSFSAESVAPTMTSDALLHYSEADIPTGEFWFRSPTHDKPNDMLDAISGAHIYGKPLIQAEAFTELRLGWDEDPAMLKTLQDRNYALGVNRMVFHVFTHNPWMDRKPGMTLGSGVGNFLQRDQTWWAQGKAWIDYTQRCQWLLQQGTPVVDLAVFTGEEIPRRAILPDRLVASLPGLFGEGRVESEQRRLTNTGEPTTNIPSGVVHSANMADPADFIDPLHGYAFDSFNPDALLRLANVRNGRVEMPGGVSYAMLVLPGASPMSPDPGMISAPSAQRLLQLVKEGASLLIDPATHYHSTGLSHAAEDDRIVRRVFHELLDGPFHSIKTDNTPIEIAAVGKGRVIKGPYNALSLDPIGLSQDLIATEETSGAITRDSTGVYGTRSSASAITHDSTGGSAAFAPRIAYTHRRAPGLDIYFVSNQSDRPVSMRFSLRVTGRQPEIWDPVTGSILMMFDWKLQHGRTIFPVKMSPHASFFIVLRRAAAPPPAYSVGYAAPAKGKKIHGPWTVRFDPAYGGPTVPVRFDSLPDWSHHADSSIRYYSGTAVYTLEFNQASPTFSAFLDLGRIANIATVKLNGIDCGTVWTPPYRVDISKALRKGKNELQIAVTNTWANRLTGDQRLPEAKRVGWTTATFHSDGRLLPAGLLGPVEILFVR
jgi:alpha-L-rhamnosidase